jgi:hypothetical protein
MRIDMGYRDDFYDARYIMGYTGQLHKDPTVYFLTQNERGRITQKHKHNKNVGREKVRGTAGYTFANELFNGRRKLVEYVNGRDVHTSRNALVQVPVDDQTSSDTRALLAQAITRFPDEKSRYASAGAGEVDDDEAWWQAQVD